MLEWCCNLIVVASTSSSVVCYLIPNVRHSDNIGVNGWHSVGWPEMKASLLYQLGHNYYSFYFLQILTQSSDTWFIHNRSFVFIGMFWSATAARLTSDQSLLFSFLLTNVTLYTSNIRSVSNSSSWFIYQIKLSVWKTDNVLLPSVRC